MHPDVIAGAGRALGGGPVRQTPAEVLLLQDLAEALRTPVGHEELQPGPVAQAAVAVVPEDAGHPVPDLGRVLRGDEGAQALGEMGVGGQPAADPQVIAGPQLGVDHPDQRDVVDLVHHVLAGVTGHGGLELARQVGQLGVPDEALLDLPDGRGGIQDLLGGHSGHGRAEDHAGDVPAGLRRGQAHGLQTPPDLRGVLDLHPVQLDVLPIRDVRGAAAELLGDPRDHAQLLQGQRTAVDAHPHHEVPVLQLGGLQLGGAPAVDAGAALGVQPPPPEPAVQVVIGDRVESLAGVDGLDALPHVESVVLELELLVVVQRGASVDLPLAVRFGGALALRGGLRSRCGT
ncbi:Uncharacterised protein [Mycobacteroides abscessus subsp. abscessus]|nr:Uncharacterised protein [Mycobacteroides abscessus subsp. abscessus]